MASKKAGPKRTTAEDITRLLREKHSGDIFVPECNTGSAWKGNIRRLDAWVMKRTWSPPTFIGYEVKVSRNDFLNDEKWREYLTTCNQFSWVCPYGLIKPEEVGDGVGLMYVSKNGNRLYTKIKAPWREIEVPWQVLMYVLMSRSEIDTPRAGGHVGDSETRWKRWLDRRQTRRDLGYEVRGKIRELYDDAIRRMHAAEAETRRYEDIRRMVRQLGLDPDRANSWQVNQEIIKRTAGELGEPEQAQRLRMTARNLENAAVVIESFWRRKKEIDDGRTG